MTAFRMSEAHEDSSNSVSFALYCRYEEKGPRKGSYSLCYDGWRNSEGWSCPLYDTIEEFLEFYAYFGEPTEESRQRSIYEVVERRTRGDLEKTYGPDGAPLMVGLG